MKHFLVIMTLAICTTLLTAGYLQAAGERPAPVSVKDIPPSNAAELAAEESAEQAFRKAAAQADAALKKSRNIGGEWQGAAELLMQAAAAAQSGDFDQAIKLADSAKNQAEEGYRAAMVERTAAEEKNAADQRKAEGQ